MQYAIAYRKQVMTEKEKIQRCFCNSRFGQWVKCLYLRQWWDCWCVRGRGKVGGMAHQTRGEWGAAWALSREQCSVDNVYSRAKRRRWLAVRNGVITLRRDTREVPSSAVQLQQYSSSTAHISTLARQPGRWRALLWQESLYSINFIVHTFLIVER